MRVRLISIGKDRSGLFEPAVQEYAKRIRRHLPFELVELPESKRREEDRAREEEGAAILSKLKGTERLWILDERGEELDSMQFARLLERAMQEGREVALAIGGDAGHGPEIRARAERTLALSRMTLAHRLARVVLTEQIYRVLSILRGEPYHRA